MEDQKGLLTEMFGWLNHPLYSRSGIIDWLGGLVVVMLVAFLWSTVVKEID